MLQNYFALCVIKDVCVCVGTVERTNTRARAHTHTHTHTPTHRSGFCLSVFTADLDLMSYN